MPRRLGTVVVALWMMLAVAGCEGPPTGAQETVSRMAALEIMSTPPPEGVLVGSETGLGSDGIAAFNPPFVTVVYATTASVAEVDEYYISSYPTYEFDQWGFYDPAYPPLELLGQVDSSTDGDIFVEIRMSFGAPDYSQGGGAPMLSPAPEGANLYVVVESFWFPPDDYG